MLLTGAPNNRAWQKFFTRIAEEAGEIRTRSTRRKIGRVVVDVFTTTEDVCTSIKLEKYLE